MSQSIFRLHDNGQFRELNETKFDSEDLLQSFLEDCPGLLAGDQMDSQNPRRWLLVKREAGVPDREEGAERWSLDHLFLDQDGVPTLVEVKRSSDSRIRREVVGQMLDYAANGIAYWPVDRLRTFFEVTCAQRDENPEQVLADFLEQPEADTDSFWLQVKTNLQAGRVRLVFVADEIPAELRRIVEFLNGQMDPAEVIAVVIRQFVGEGGIRTLVPQVVGQTAESEKKKSASLRQKRKWDEESFFVALGQHGDEVAVRGARRLYEWSVTKLPDIWWGEGASMGSFFPAKELDGLWYAPCAAWTSGHVEFQFQHLMNKPPFDSLEVREEFRRRLNEVEGISISGKAVSKRPSVGLSVLAKDESWAQFQEVMGWFLDTVAEGSSR